MAYEPRGEHGGGGQDGTSMKARGRSKYSHSLPFIDNPVSCIRILDSFVRRACWARGHTTSSEELGASQDEPWVSTVDWIYPSRKPVFVIGDESILIRSRILLAQRTSPKSTLLS